MSSTNDPPIVITGGSVTIEIPGGLFQGLLGGTGFSNQQKEIKRVEITGDGIQNYDETATGNDITVKIHFGNP
jgi:hypothetical protein